MVAWLMQTPARIDVSQSDHIVRVTNANGSQPQVAAGSGVQRLGGSDVAVDEDVDASVPGLGGDPVDATPAMAAVVACPARSE